MKLYEYTATELSTLLREKKVSATEIAKETLLRIESTEPQIDAFITVTGETALEQAKHVDEIIATGGVLGALAGIPIAVKDNISTKNIKTTCASKMLENYVPPFDATVIEKLNNAGALLVGKTNMDEFAMGSSSESSYFKKTKNPWDFNCVPGGSSGGSAAAVAACQTPLALGSDTGGSVRQPASFCGILGLKPTYGAVSRYGLLAFASSLDQIGPLARSVDDVALLYQAICGQDKRDATSKPVNFKGYGNTMKGMKLGIPKQYFGDGIDAIVKETIYQAVEEMKKLGAEVIEVSLPSTDYALSAYYILSSAEASSNLARFDGVKYGFSAGWGGSITNLYETTRSEGFGDEVKRRIMLGTYVLSSGYYDAYYKRAKALQKVIAAEFDDALKTCDAIVTPLSPTTAYKFGENQDDPVAMYAGDICSVTLNIAGLPGLSVPCGFDESNLPIGMQLIGAKFSESTLLSIAKTYETAMGGFKVKGL